MLGGKRIGEGVTPVLLLGAGGFAEEVADIVADCPGFEVVGFVESVDRARCKTTSDGLPVHWVDDIAPFAGTHLACCALGTTDRVEFTTQVAAAGIGFATIIHPTAHVSATAVLAAGVLVSAGVVVGARSTIAEHAILNRGVLIGHHVEIGAYASLMPGANIAGFTVIGEQAYVGMGALVLNNVRVGRNTLIGAGSVVTRDVVAGSRVVGIPARLIEPVVAS
ncbi:MAG: acetyltransferase [Actinomycetes bacterium]